MATKAQTPQELEGEAALEGAALTFDTQAPFVADDDELKRMLAEKEALIADLEAKLAAREFPAVEEPETPVEVVFRCEVAPDLVQYITEAVAIQFHGQFFRTSDQGTIQIMRGLIDSGMALFHEDDPVAILRCPHCEFTSTSWATVKTHSRQRHPSKPPLGEAIPGMR